MNRDFDFERKEVKEKESWREKRELVSQLYFSCPLFLFIHVEH